MMRISSVGRVAALVASISMLLMAWPGGAQARTLSPSSAADVAPAAAVNYHLQVTWVAGPKAGQVLDGSVAGMEDGTGLITATLTLTTGITSTVTGTISNTVALSVQGSAATAQLNGASEANGKFGGLLDASAGAWMLTPQTAAAFAFSGMVRSGADRGTSYEGDLNVALDKSNHFDGTLTLLNHSVLRATGSMMAGNLQVVVYLPHGGAIMGVASYGHLPLSPLQQSFNGSFAGPRTGDSGTWVSFAE